MVDIVEPLDFNRGVKMTAVDKLCPNCGLCCDGTLFADVELRAGDDAKRLEKLGLSAETKGKVKIAFAQPCACFDGKLCEIYGERPKHCRMFECGLLKKVNAGEMKSSAALKRISRAKDLIAKIQELLKAFEGDDESAELSKRYARAMESPMDLTAGNADQHGELMRAYAEWMTVAQKEFLNSPGL
jgi:Fe-S-cluster containining protein